MNSKLITYKNACMTIALGCLCTLSSLQASTVNRNDVYGVFDKLDTKLSLSGLDVWVNENVSEPSVDIGDSVYFTMKSDDSVFYTLFHVDSKGMTSILLPMAESIDRDAKGSDYLIYPSLTDRCSLYIDDQSCFKQDNQLEQVGPIGKDTVYLLASKQPLSADLLGMRSDEDYRDLGNDLQTMEKLVERINRQAKTNPLSVVRYSYSVESASTQYSSRSLRKKVSEMEKASVQNSPTELMPLVFDKINFAFNSAELTEPGQVELDGLGSALVDIQEEKGEFPVVELTGHTDSIGPDSYNTMLSVNRAASAKQYLVQEHGIPADQVLTVGAGESIPVDDNGTQSGRAMNRRVEFMVVKAE